MTTVNTECPAFLTVFRAAQWIQETLITKNYNITELLNETRNY